MPDLASQSCLEGPGFFLPFLSATLSLLAMNLELVTHCGKMAAASPSNTSSPNNVQREEMGYVAALCLLMKVRRTFSEGPRIYNSSHISVAGLYLMSTLQLLTGLGKDHEGGLIPSRIQYLRLRRDTVSTKG